jgi:hypothetical protein
LQITLQSVVIKLKALTAEGIAINSVVKNTEPKMDSYQKQTYDAPHNSRKKTNGNNRHNHRSVTKDWLTSIGCNLMQYLTPATIRYKPLDDLETKISAQIKQAIHLDNVTFTSNINIRQEKEVPKLLSKSITAQQITIQEKETTPMIAVTKPR